MGDTQRDVEEVLHVNAGKLTASLSLSGDEKYCLSLASSSSSPIESEAFKHVAWRSLMKNPLEVIFLPSLNGDRSRPQL